MTVAGGIGASLLPAAVRARLRRALRGTGAAVTGLLLVAVLGGLAVLGGGWAGGWTAGATAPGAGEPRAVAVSAAESVLVCPPPATLPEGADVGDEQFRATPVATASRTGVAVLGGVPDGLRTTALDGSQAAGLTQGSAAAVAQGDVTTARVLHATPVPGVPLRAAGALASVTTTGDLRGLAAGRCGEPATSHWLVGGSTEVGESAQLTVQNPSPRPATVSLEAFGPGGAVTLGGSASFVVGARAQRVVRLESVAPGQRRLVVHVEAAGARVVASLQGQAIEGLVPTGLDVVTPGAAPARSFVVGGVVSAGETLDDPHAPRLRLLAPRHGGTARVGVYGPSGPVTLRGAQAMTLERGVVVDVPLGGLPAGSYTVVVDADVPVVGAARYDVRGEPPADAVVDTPPYDVAWSPGQAVSAARASDAPVPVGQLALPAGVRSVLTLASLPAERGPDAEPRGTTTVTVRAFAADGSELESSEVELAAGTAVTLGSADLGGEEPAAVTVDRTGGDALPVAWTANVAADDGTGTPGTLVAVLAPTPAVTAPSDVRVRRVDAGG